MFIFCLWETTAFCGQSEQHFPFIASILKDQVNVRAGPSTNFEKLMSLNKGEEVVVLERNYSWYKIKLPSQARCYISQEFVKIINENVGEVIANRVNLRAGAGVQFSVIGQVNKGDPVHIIEHLEEWYRIEPPQNSYGWLLAEYLGVKS